jgi:hypothetical protein
VSEQTYQLVVQPPSEDLDTLVALEESVEQELGGAGEVDGHDIGTGESNVFILTSDPRATFEKLRPALAGISSMRVAYRRIEPFGDWVILYPPDLREFGVA